MIKTLGNNIVNAFTGGNPVKAIYAYGEKVWPNNNDYIFYDYLQSRWPVWEEIDSLNSTLRYEAPVIEFEIPYIEGGFIIEASVMFQSTIPIMNSSLCVFFNTCRNNNDTYRINGAFLSAQGDSYFIRTGYTRSNIGKVIPLGNHTLKEIIPANNLDTKIYVDNTEVVKSDDYAKKSYIFSVSEPIKFYLFDYGTMIGSVGSNHHLKRFKIMDSSNDLLYDFVPAVRKEDGAPGLLEVIHNTFHTKSPQRYNDEGVLDFNYGNY